MQKLTLIIVTLLFAAVLFADPYTCYDIQYTTSTSGDSPYVDQVVTVQGIVSVPRFYTSNGANNYGFMLTDAQGGAWSGLFVYNQTNQPALGDMVTLTGTVTEYYGFTEITSVTSYQVISTNNPLPQAVSISTAALANSSTAEQWESVLVKVSNVTVQTMPTNYQEFFVTDGSGNCQIDNQCFPFGHTWSNIAQGLSFASISGVVDYSYSTYGLNPRSLDDMVFEGSNLTLIFPQAYGTLNGEFAVPLNASNIDPASNYQSYTIQVAYNPMILAFSQGSTNGTLSAPGTLDIEGNNGVLNINYSSTSDLSGSGILFNLLFTAIQAGVSPLTLSNVHFDNHAINNVINGSVTINSNYNAPGDTLTVIQRPILNVPAIQIPGETMSITCLAPQNTTGFNAWLVHGSKRISLPLLSSTWQSNPNRWELQVNIPQVAVFELYDLEVNANGGIHDVSRNAVQIIPSRKSNYYFIHLTDLHMPTRIYYPDAGYDADSLSVVDFRAVMDDINLLRPEFVLITGDLINDGEQEGFNNQYWYGWVQRILSEMEVPIYVTAGNHDIGGWNTTPPPDGSSRRSWWRYFGWSWLDNESTSWPYHTQDYYFTYGNTVYIGLESYDNYDGWRWEIYGNESYTNQQMSWLYATTALFPSHQKVLFHHYDFQEELDLYALDLDMSLWGHIHSNSGSVNTQPYDLATRSTCDGNRAYRVIRVNGNQITPYNSVTAGATGSNVSISFFPSNYAVADSVSATVVNGHSLAFENTLIKFLMPAGGTGYIVTNGTLEQIDRTTHYNVCYVRVNLLASSTRVVTIKSDGVANIDPVQIPAVISIASSYPNPVRDTCNIELFSPKQQPDLTLQVYNLKGQKVQEKMLTNLSAGINNLSFTPDSSLSSGIYFLRIKGTIAKPHKLILIK